jgi:hypothetical protein
MNAALVRWSQVAVYDPNGMTQQQHYDVLMMCFADAAMQPENRKEQ